ncbi:hypothetical protein [Candidatus Halobonum tyrrellensis]|uniref:CopG family transcriptional regulator n=1 Tax=Candidatus Halobonum tyrrellensis G22 TaxID=1324957 RepID=V4IUN8_9EURY|nr:hypothetical protein [Candidatus Halobonum tyrrellensis]ESP86907.1 hypothetical protein K933_16637 [Candidatus Halobonum tyrrellensis G22]
MTDGSDAADSREDTDEDTTNVAIRDSIHERVAARVEGTDFETPAEYVEYTLEEVLSRVEEGSTTTGAAADPLDRENDDEDNEEVESRLESLGYL